MVSDRDKATIIILELARDKLNQYAAMVTPTDTSFTDISLTGKHRNTVYLINNMIAILEESK